VSKARRQRSPNADLAKVVQNRTEDILDFYEKFEGDRPVIVLDFQNGSLRAYNYEN
jgi:hypothetical protein